MGDDVQEVNWVCWNEVKKYIFNTKQTKALYQTYTLRSLYTRFLLSTVILMLFLKQIMPTEVKLEQLWFKHEFSPVTSQNKSIK